MPESISANQQQWTGQTPAVNYPTITGGRTRRQSVCTLIRTIVITGSGT